MGLYSSTESLGVFSYLKDVCTLLILFPVIIRVPVLFVRLKYKQDSKYLNIYLIPFLTNPKILTIPLHVN